MITYLKESKTFILNGESYSYVLYVNAAGYLQSVYFGARIDCAPYLTEVYGKSLAPDKNNINYECALDSMPSEYACFGHGDFSSPSALIEQADGFAASSFKYLSHKIYSGVPEIAGMPCARSGGQTLAIKLKDEFSGVEITLNYTVFEGSDVIVRNAEFFNCGKEDVKLSRAFSFCMTLPDFNYDIMRLQGKWGAERTPVKTAAAHGTLRIESTRGVSSHQMNPFLALLRKNCAEEQGECIGINIIYSGSFAMTAEVTQCGALRVQGGINDFCFGWKLAKKQSFSTPQVAVCYSRRGLGEMSRQLADFFRERIISPDFAYKKRPVVINNWEATYFDFDKNKLFKIIDAAADAGADTFVLDDGWFGKRDDDFSGLGDWVVNEKKIEGGLKSVYERCKLRGMKFGLWFEPEMVNEDSELFRAHPDWAISKEGITPVRSRNQLVLDFTRKEVVDYIYNAVYKVISENGISYVKWDMNRNLTEFYSKSLPADRQGEFAHRYVLGVYDLAKRLTEAFPDVLFEGCSSGGGRFDGGMLYYFPQIWTSDDTDAYERAKIQWGTSVCYPVSSMSCHVSACPNHQTRRITPLDTRACVASVGTFGYELDLSKLSKEEIQKVREQIAFYRSIDELVLKGDLYRLLNPFEGNRFCQMLVSKDKSRAYIAGLTVHAQPNDGNEILHIFGLAEDKNYYIKELDITASGRTLANAGVLLPRLPDFGSWQWNIEEIRDGEKWKN